MPYISPRSPADFLQHRTALLMARGLGLQFPLALSESAFQAEF